LGDDSDNNRKEVPATAKVAAKKEEALSSKELSGNSDSDEDDESKIVQMDSSTGRALPVMMRAFGHFHSHSIQQQYFTNRLARGRQQYNHTHQESQAPQQLRCRCKTTSIFISRSSWSVDND
jgi:hypothetical protein